MLAVLLQHAEDEIGQRVGDFGGELLQVGYWLREDRRDLGGEALAFERQAASQHLEQQHAEGPDVAEFIGESPWQTSGLR